MSEKSKIKNKPRIFLIPVFIVAVDQVTKTLWENFFSISCNRGIGFGLAISSTAATLITVVILIYLFYLSLKEKSRFELPLAFVIGGGLSNLIDRLSIGCVRDFINLGFWPSFNLADSAITFGVILMIYNLLLKKDET